ncbi:TrkH family potassium uptake protein [Hyperthermus butylicus]|uniref:Trk-type K+ transport system, membrane component n=1 Tax=Hyperthermus butylicus (strain DSM 5456 / JCM 9403 / PLM1-5) TaxID=415426 RepID=A2BK65_HYPBU|nr:TrkH family potassium uptake protein [Hyperthermus butylicus]ABM80376.1 Trk-type K+ transport system, membrane component [Hyperthermus butylicus DSM 5456]
MAGREETSARLEAVARRQRHLPLRVNPLLRYTSLPFIVAGLSHVLAGIFGLFEGDHNYSLQLLAWGSIFIAVGYAWINFMEPSRSITREEAIVLVAYSWVTTPIISALPVYVSLGIPFIDAWFESVSGFTATGLTIFTGQVNPDYGVYIPSIEELPASILWWRAVTEWFGGFGIVVMFFTMVRLGGLPAHLVGFAEGRFERLEPSIARSLRALMELYLMLTIMGAIGLYLAGMTPSDAVYHSMTGIATGGFSTHTTSIGFYDSLLIESVTVVIMLTGAMNFADLYAILKGIPRRFSGEIQSLLAVAFLASTAAAVMLYTAGWSPKGFLRDAIFHVVSALTGTGFGIDDLSSAPPDFKALLIPIMLIGGSIFSTSSGLKQYRLMVIVKSILWSVSEVIYGGRRVIARSVGGRPVTISELQNVISVAALLTLTEFAGALALSALLPTRSFVDAAFETASALANVGLSVGITSAAASIPVKLVLIVIMTLGRLEVAGFLFALASLAKMLRR